MKKFYFLILLVVFVAVSVWLGWSYFKYAKVNTGQTKTVLNLEVTGGKLRQDIVEGIDGETKIELEGVLLGNYDTETGGLITTLVKDHRGNSLGWTQTISSSDFTSGENVIDVSNLTINPTIIIPLGESDLSGVFLGEKHRMKSEIDQAVIMYAIEGAGDGRFKAESIMELLIEKNTLPGKYTSDIVITIS